MRRDGESDKFRAPHEPMRWERIVEMEHIVLKVEGMSCGHCVNAVETAVKTLGATAKADLSGGSVAIDYDPSELTVQSLKDAIEDQGYDVI